MIIYINYIYVYVYVFVYVYMYMYICIVEIYTEYHGIYHVS